MPWKIFDYDQSVTIDTFAVELAGYEDGVCLALSMLWCRSKKRKLGVQGFRGQIQALPGLLAQWMATVQDQPLTDLMAQDGYKYYQGQTPISDVGHVRGRVNNMVAYAHRLERMSQWARQNGLALLDDAVGFPSSAAAAGREAGTRACNPPGGRSVLGLISLTGNGGHAMAFRYSAGAYVTAEFFDPNEGAWGFRSAVEFTQWLSGYVRDNYPDLGEQWWVLHLT